MKILKTISAAMAVCLLAGSCIMPAAVQALEPDYCYGDFSMDGKVDVTDAVMIARFCVQDRGLQITDTGKIQADVNLDGNVNDEDLLQVLEFIARKRTALGRQTSAVQPKYQTVCLTEGIEPDGVTVKNADETFRASQFKLTADLFRGAAQDPQSSDNVLISPLSVSQALAMTANGAEDNTKAQMEKLLGDTIGIEELNQYYLGYTGKLTASDELHLANSLWVRNDEHRIQVPKEFLQTTKDYYNADVFKAPFDDSTVDDVNGWVTENTHGMIPQLIDEMDENWIMLLINALAFEAEWASPYTVDDIYNSTFHAYDGDMTAAMMYSNVFSYLEDEYATGFLKNYEGGKYSFAAVLPKQEKSVTVSDYIGMMTGESLQNLLDSRQDIEVKTVIPKFKYEYTLMMNNVLKGLGMTDAFTYPDARFGKLNSVNPECYIDLVLHKTFIQVDDRGTKAGAVTMVAMADNAVSMRETKEVILDRPFIYMIVDNETNLPVFIGYVMHPTAAEEAE